MKRHHKEKVIYGLFDSTVDLERAYNRLLVAGIADDDISLLMNEEVHTRDFKMIDRTRSGDGMVAGTAIGGALGGILGGVAALGTALTGIGLVVVGPMLALAAAGGLIGGWVGSGIPEEEARRLQAALRDGHVMIAVHTHDAVQIAIAEKVLARSHGDQIEISA